MLITKEMHNSYNKFLFHSFLSALHVSKESSRSSSGAQHNILYYTHSTIGTIVQASLDRISAETGLLAIPRVKKREHGS